MAGPLYRQIADQLRRLIESGELQVGTQIPTVAQKAVAQTLGPRAAWYTGSTVRAHLCPSGRHSPSSR